MHHRPVLVAPFYRTRVMHCFTSQIVLLLVYIEWVATSHKVLAFMGKLLAGLFRGSVCF